MVEGGLTPYLDLLALAERKLASCDGKKAKGKAGREEPSYTPQVVIICEELAQPHQPDFAHPGHVAVSEQTCAVRLNFFAIVSHGWPICKLAGFVPIKIDLTSGLTLHLGHNPVLRIRTKIYLLTPKKTGTFCYWGSRLV